LSWQDILKETIAQNRVKEIEDIDIDIDEDDCRRWYDKLIKIYEGFNFNRGNDALRIEGVYSDLPELDEQTACLLKEDLTKRYNINTTNMDRENRAKEIYRKHGFLTAGNSLGGMAYGVQIYTLLERLGDKRDTEYGDIGIDIYLSWRSNPNDSSVKKVNSAVVLTDERLKKHENSIKELLRHLEQTWAIDTLTRYGAFK
jgi:hypothetical protein